MVVVVVAVVVVAPIACPGPANSKLHRSKASIPDRSTSQLIAVLLWSLHGLARVL